MRAAATEITDQQLLALEVETTQKVELSLREIEVLNSAVECSREVLEHHEVDVPADIKKLEGKIKQAREDLLRLVQQKIRNH